MVLKTDLSVHFDFISILKSSEKPSQEQKPAADPQLLIAAIKIADLGHTVKAWPQHERWSRAVEEEFFALGDRERAQGLPVAPMCCRIRDKGRLPESQMGFLEFLVEPLLDAASRPFPHVRFLLERLELNRKEWERRKQAGDDPVGNGE